MRKSDKNEIKSLGANAFYWCLGIFLLNVLLKSIFLGFPAIGLDEPFTLFRAQKTYGELIADLAKNNHPPLFESIMWIWIRIVGYNAVLLRIVPMLFSSLATAAIFRLAQKHFSLATGLIASLLFTFSNYHFYLSHETRSYPLFALLTALSFTIYLNLLAHDKVNKKDFAALVLLNTLLLYTHYFSATIIAAQLFHAFVLGPRKHKYTMLKILALTLVLYLPQIIMVTSRWVQKVENGHWLKAPNLAELFNVLAKFFNAPVIAVLALALIGFAVFFAFKKADFKKLSVIVLLFPGVFIGMWIMAQKVSVFQDRYISFTLVGAFILIGYSLAQFPKKIGIILSVLLIASMAFTNHYKPVNKQWVAEMVEIVKREKTQNTKVFIYPKWSLQCFSFYYNLAYFKNYTQTETLLGDENISLGYKEEVAQFISDNNENQKYIIINFEGSISDLAKDYGHLKPLVIEKNRHGIMILEKK